MSDQIRLISKNSKDSPALCYWCEKDYNEKKQALWRLGVGFLTLENSACTMHAHLLIYPDA